MDRYSKQTPRASHRRRALFTYLPFFHPDYTVGVGLADHSAHRTPASNAMRHPLAGLPFWNPKLSNDLHGFHKQITADRELGLHPHPALKVLS
jgi:hypothetical protein